jgi:hypothetical protein
MKDDSGRLAPAATIETHLSLVQSQRAIWSGALMIGSIALLAWPPAARKDRPQPSNKEARQ